MRGALIDDCALGALMKGQGPIWLGLTESVDSLRAYPTFADFRRMVARSAFAELRYSPLRLAGAIAGMALVYLAPPLFALFGAGRGAGGWRARVGDDGGCAHADAAALRASPRWRSRPAGRRPCLCRLHLRLRATILAGARRLLEGTNPGADAGDGARMTTVSEALSGKGSAGREFSRRLMASQRSSGAVRSSPSIASCAPPTMSPITRPCLRRRSLSFSTISTMR